MYLKAEDIMKILDISQASAYRIILKLNNELNENGFYTVKGRTSKKYFQEKYNVEKEVTTHVGLQR